MKAIDQVIDEIYPTLESIEGDRQAYLSKKKSFMLWAVLPGLAIALAISILLFPFGLFGSVIAGIIGAIIYSVTIGKAGKAYASSYKDTVIEKLVNQLDRNLHFDQQSGLEETFFRHSELFNTSPDRYHTEDLIHGTYGKTSVKLGEIHAQQRQTSTDSKGNTQTNYVTIFKGLLLVADFHKHFHGRTFVFPDIAEKTFGGFGRALQKMGGRSGTQLVQMDDAEFEQAYAVHSTDQVEARYILSPAMMRRILDLNNKFGNDIRIAFKESSVWIAVPHRSPFLEPDPKIPANDRAQVEKMLSELSTFIELVEELDLNTRIWTKN